MIRIGHKYRMVHFPIEEHAVNYCTEAGFFEGCSCEVIGMLGTSPKQDSAMTIILEKDGVKMEVGSTFFRTYFKRDYRTENLDKLLD
jgi:hypothetical protein